MLRLTLKTGALALALSSAPSLAATASAAITVSATVVSTCSVGGSTVSFGVYAEGTAATQQAALTVNCSTGTAYQVSLNDGLAGNASTRKLSGPGGSTLSYDLYRDASRTQRWRDGASSAVGVGSGEIQTLPLYAAIAPSAAGAGSYSDTVTATLTY